MSEKKDKGKDQLDKIVAELMALANDLASGKLRVGSILEEVGEPSSYKTKQKLKGDEVDFTLSFKVTLRNVREKHAAGADDAEGKRLASAPQKKRPQPAERPAGSKRIKKELSRLWKSITRKIGNAEAPVQAEMAALMKLCDDYTMYADKVWAADWDACRDTVRNVLAAAAGGDFGHANELVAEINHMIKRCHRQYK